MTPGTSAGTKLDTSSHEKAGLPLNESSCIMIGNEGEQSIYEVRSM
jgi:hypothetical protein